MLQTPAWQRSGGLGLVEFKKCAIFWSEHTPSAPELGLVEFKKCAIFFVKQFFCLHMLGLVEFKKCAILHIRVDVLYC